ncbi:uncharacterized protein LOC142097314 isoform X2 [Mixophyes fleayi]|uniref:uncharacterized protein LOC142097314 isoform X2 n=1 Tax=Mixophyes fleayi TaxID=3061075 RepID=UPI003F4E3B32
MARPGPVLLLLLLYLTAGAALDVSAPTSHIAQMGSNVILPCSFTVNSPTINFNFLAIIWQFKENTIVSFDTKGMTVDKRRFISQQDISKGIADLHIQNVTTSDIGAYKCTIVYSPDTKMKEVKLTVYAPPVITHLEKVRGGNERNRFVCFVAGFYPIDITVDLLKDGKVIEGSPATSQMNNDGTFSVNRTVIIPSEEKPKVLSCRVRHESLTADLQQSVQLLYDGDNSNVGMVVGIVVAGIVIILAIIAIILYKKKSGFQEIVVSNIQGAKLVDGEKTTLFCTASNSSQNTLVTWIIKNKDGTMCEVSESPAGDKEEEQPLMSREYMVTMEKIPSQKKKGLYDVTTKLTFIPSISRHLGANVTCKVVSDKKAEEKNYEFKSIHAKPTFIDPVQFTLSNQEDVQLSAGLHRFYPKTMQITWVSKKAQSEEKIPSQEETMNNTDATFNLKSKCTVPGELFKDPTYKVIVTWKHESMDVSQSRELSVKDLPWQPQIQDPPIESVFQDDEVHLRCTVSNYFPDALTVKWFEKKKGSQDLLEVSHSEKYTIPKITSNRTDNKTFTSRAVLSFKKSHLSEKDVAFICRVEHPSLEKTIESSTQQLQDTDVQDFIVNNVQGPQTWYDGEKVTLYCAALYCTEDTKVTWFVTEKDGTVCEIPTGEDMRRDGPQSPGYLALRERTDVSDIEGLLDVTTSLSFTPSISKHKKITVGCKIVSGGRTKEKTFQRKHLFAKPKVVNPMRLSLTDLGEVLCLLDIDGIYPKQIQIKWNDTETLNSKEVLTNTDGTCNVHSEYKIPGNFFKDPKSTVIVSWKHESMEGWESRQVSVLDKEFPWKPEVQDIPVPNLLIGSTATLRCEVSNVFPDVLNVRWLKKERHGQELFPLVLSDKYSISEIKPEKQKDNTFTYKTCLKFKPSINTEEGAEFICRVEHPSLERATEKSTGPLCIKGLPVVKDIVCTGEGIYSLAVNGIYPQKTTVLWKLSVQASTEESEPLISTLTCKDNEDGSYQVMSICDLSKTTIDLDKWSVLQATVEHETLDSPISKSIGIKNTSPLSQEKSPTEHSLQTPVDGTTDLKATIPQKDDHQIFIVGKINGPNLWTHGEKITLYCSASHCPDDVNVIWTVTERDGKQVIISNAGEKSLREPEALMTSGYFLTTETEKSDKEGLFHVTSLMTLIPSVSKHVGTDLTCKIISNGKTKIRKFQPKSIHAKPVPGDVRTSLCNSGDVLCSLDLHNIYPKQLTLNWTKGQTQLPFTEEWKENTDNIYTVYSQCTVPGHLFMDPSTKVCVTWKHKSMDKPESRVLSGRDLGLAWRPEIQEVPIPHVIMGKKTTLQYNISRYFPDVLSVSWYKKEAGGQIYNPISDCETYKMSVTQSQRQPDNTYCCTARLVITPSLRDQGSDIICRVEHPSLETPIERSTGPLLVMGKPGIRKSIKQTLGKEEVKYSLVLENFYPKDIHIQWCYGSGEVLTQTCSSKEKSRSNLDKTFSVTSECALPENLLNIPDLRVRVTWTHESMDDPGRSEVSIRDKDYPWRPEMVISVPSLRMNEEALLQCTISKYFPNALSVMWLRKDIMSGETFYVPSNGMYKVSNNDLGRQTNNTFSCKSCLNFIPTLDTEDGAEFICRVEHPSLVQPMERSTGILQITVQAETYQENPLHGHNFNNYHNPSSPYDAADEHKGFVLAEPYQEYPPQHDVHNFTDYSNPPLSNVAADRNEVFGQENIPLNNYHTDMDTGSLDSKEEEMEIG